MSRSVWAWSEKLCGARCAPCSGSPSGCEVQADRRRMAAVWPALCHEMFGAVDDGLLALGGRGRCAGVGGVGGPLAREASRGGRARRARWRRGTGGGRGMREWFTARAWAAASVWLGRGSRPARLMAAMARRTEDAVARLQAARGLRVDGIAGPGYARGAAPAVDGALSRRGLHGAGLGTGAVAAASPD